MRADAAALTRPTGVPHSPQNCASASGAAARGARSGQAEPHWRQNLRPASFSVPQFEQITASSRWLIANDKRTSAPVARA